jgi:peptidoglycan/LPS O-acetylase OafA/YrhL
VSQPNGAIPLAMSFGRAIIRGGYSAPVERLAVELRRCEAQVTFHPNGASMKQRIDFLDSVRGIAVLLVFVFHSLGAAFNRETLPWGIWFRDFGVPRSFLPVAPASFGWVGVAIFFVVSGFCIHLSFSRQPQWSAFFWRRFFRVYPAYLAALLFFAFVYPITRSHFASRIDFRQIVSHLLLLHNFEETTFLGINPSFWTLAVEVQLYALYPILLVLCRSLGWRRTLIGVAALEISLRLTDGVMFTASGAGLPRWVTGSPLTYWFSWSVGAYVAERYIRNVPLLIPRPLTYSVGALAVAVSFFKPVSGLSFMLFALVAAAAIATVINSREQTLPLPGMLREHLGDVGLCSYSVYLLHQPLLAGLAAIITGGAYIHPLFLFAVCLASWIVIVPLASLSYQFCELPGLALGKRFGRRDAVINALPRAAEL